MRHYVWWVRGKQHGELAALSVASVQRVDRFAVERQLLIVTDDEDAGNSWFPSLPNQGRGVLRTVHKPGRPAMVANLDAQIAALLAARMGDQVLFLDADTLLTRPFEWPCGAELVTTWRDHVNGDARLAMEQPFNYGVLGAVVSAETIEAFFWLRARILQMSRKSQDWYGNQIALAELVGQPAPRKLAPISWTLEDVAPTRVSVACLPCLTWNYSPDGPNEDISARGVLHLKGGRKDLMQHYAARLAA